MAKLNRITLPLYKDGVIREKAVDETLAPPTSCQYAQNVHFDSIGAVTTRPGLTLLGATVEDGETVLGMHNYINNAGDTYVLLAKLNGSVYAYDGSSWTEVRTSLTSTSKARFTSLVDYTFMVNGNANNDLATYNGSGSFGITNKASLPKGDVIENYRSRIWVGDSATDKLYYSNVVTTSQTITGGTSYIQISPQDGDKITGLKRHPRALLVFKKNHIYKVYNINLTDPDPSINLGTYSQESIIEAKDGISYHHPSGFYKFHFDGAQEEISRPIIDVVDAISRAYYPSICGWEDGDHLYWSIGDITLGGVDFTNVVCRRTISTQVWTIYNYATEIRSASKYDNGTTIITAVGDDGGDVFTFNSGTTDNSSAIHYDLETHWYYITNNKSDKKDIEKISTLFENAQGANVSYKVDMNNKNEWEPIGEIKKELVHDFSLNAKGFIRIKFRINGTISGNELIFRGFELLSNHAYEQKELNI